MPETTAVRSRWIEGPWPALIVFLAALLTRVLWITVLLNPDETLWVRRAPAFYTAIMEGNPEDTFLKHHPGVPGMWVIGAGIIARYELRDMLPTDRVVAEHDSLREYLHAVETDLALPLGTYAAARVAAALVTSVAMAGIYLLSRRLFGAQVALLAAIFLLLEPFFVAYQRSITTDAFQTNFTWLSFLAFLIYYDRLDGSRQRRGWLIFSGVMFGLAVLSKVSAATSAPAFLVVALAWSMRRHSRPGVLITELALWGVSGLVVAFLAWPALRADLPGTLAIWRSGLAEEVDGHLQYFAGVIARDPGPAYYPVVLLFRLSPLLLIGTALGIFALIRPVWRRHVTNVGALAAVVLFIVTVLIGITVFASKTDRYIQPLIPGLSLLAGAGIWAAVGRWGAKRARPGAPRLAPVALAVLLLQLIAVATALPYYLTYYNPLVGGARVAQRVMMIGNGELMDRAGAWLQEHAPGSRVASWMPGVLSSYYGEPVLPVLRELDREYWSLVEANYVVLYINQMQRDTPALVTQYFRPQRPVYTARREGVEYVAIYPGPAVSAEDAALLPEAEPLDFDGSVKLVGRQLETPRVAAGENAGITVYWQPVGPFAEPDTRALLRVVDARGRVWGQTYRELVGGMLRVEDWPDDQLIRDYQTVRVLPGTPPGDYALELGLYSQAADRSLPITGPDGPRGNRIVLDRITVERPGDAAVVTQDLGVNTVLAREVRLSPEGPRLLGVDWPAPTTARAGDGFAIAALWQAGTAAPQSTSLLLQLDDGTRTWRRKVGHPLGEERPPTAWAEGEMVREAWTAYLPADAPSGRYDVVLVAVDAAGEHPLVELGALDLVAREHDTAAPRPAIVQEEWLSDGLRLTGYDLVERLTVGAPITLTLFWQAVDELPADYVRFAHLLDADGRIVAQSDAAPGAGDYPTASWIAGETIPDEVRLDLPSDLPPGTYRIAVGMVDPFTGTRLTTRAGQDVILLSRPAQVSE